MPTHDLLTIAYERALPRRKGPQPGLDTLINLQTIAQQYLTNSTISPGVPASLALEYATNEIRRRQGELTYLLERRP